MYQVTLEVPKELEEADPIALAIFSNGQINSESSIKLKCSLYQKKGERNKKKRTLVAETDHMTYVGTNYESEATLTTPSFRRYMVGVLDKDTDIMTLHKADLFNMGPYIKGFTGAVAMETESPEKSERLTREEYGEAFDKMMSSFGSQRAKKAWSASKRNKVESYILDTSLTPAISHAEEEVQKAAEEDPESLVVQTSPFIPICNTGATVPEDVYNLNDIISPEEMKLLSTPAKTLIKATPEKIKDWRAKESQALFVLSHINDISKRSGDAAIKLASILVYCDCLVKMYLSKPKDIEKFGLKRYSFIPEPLQAKLLDKFTEHGPQGVPGTQRAFTQRMKDKVLAYLFVLALKVEGYTLNSAVLQKDLLIQSTKMVDVFRALGCSVSADSAVKRSDSYTPKHYNIVLQIPLVFPNLQKGSRKRRN